MSRRFMFDCFVRVMGAALALLATGVGEARARNEVQEDQKLTASDAAEDDEFGHSVYVSGDTGVRPVYRPVRQVRRRCRGGLLPGDCATDSNLSPIRVDMVGSGKLRCAS